MDNQHSIGNAYATKFLADQGGANVYGHMHLLRSAQQLIQEDEQVLTDCIAEARQDSMSWQQVGDAPGLSFLAAHEKFG